MAEGSEAKRGRVEGNVHVVDISNGRQAGNLEAEEWLRGVVDWMEETEEMEERVGGLARLQP